MRTAGALQDRVGELDYSSSFNDFSAEKTGKQPRGIQSLCLVERAVHALHEKDAQPAEFENKLRPH